MNIEIYKIQKKLKKNLDENRYIHTLGVAQTAYFLAMSHGYDMEKAYIAGLLHDCAKNLSITEMLSLCKEYQLEISEIEKNNIGLLHSKAGVCLAQKKYKITDTEILESISWHTTGKPNMSVLDKIIFIADYIEPNRKPLPNIENIRMLAFRDLNNATIAILKNTFDHLNKSNVLIHPIAKETYQFYLNHYIED